MACAPASCQLTELRLRRFREDGCCRQFGKFEGGRIVRVGGLQRKLLLEALFSTGVCWRYWVTKYSRLKGGVYVIISSFQWSCRAETFHGRWCQSSLLLLVDISWHAEMWVFHNFSMLFHVTSYIFIWFGGWFIVFMATSQNWGCLKNSPKNGFIGSLSSCQGSLSTAYDASRCTKKPEKSTISIYFFMVGTWELPTEPPKKDNSGEVEWILEFFMQRWWFFVRWFFFFFRLPLSFTTRGFRWFFFGLPWAGDSVNASKISINYETGDSPIWRTLTKMCCIFQWIFYPPHALL